MVALIVTRQEDHAATRWPRPIVVVEHADQSIETRRPVCFLFFFPFVFFPLSIDTVRRMTDTARSDVTRLVLEVAPCR